MLLQPTKEGGRAGAWRGHTGASRFDPTFNRFPRAQPKPLNIFTPSQTKPAKPSVFPRNTPRQAAILLMPTAPPAPGSEPGPNASVDSVASPLSFLAMQSLPVIFDMHSQVGVIRLGAFRLRPLEELIMFLNHICKRALISRWPGERGHFVPLNPCLQPGIPNTEQPLLQPLNVIRFKEWIINIERCDCSQAGWLISY